MKELSIRNESVIAALDVAITGKTDKLYAELVRASGLPGVRANVPLANAFADECARRGHATDALLTKMAALSADNASGGSPFEYLPMCGVLGWGARGASDAKARGAALTLLHESADDLRYRVREAVILSLERMGAATGDELLADVAPWMDGFFHAAAVLTALVAPAWLHQTHDPALATLRLHEGAELIREAPRSAMRYPGYKALLDALRAAPKHLAQRHGGGVLDEVKRWTEIGSVDLRELAMEAVRDEKTKARFLTHVTAVHESRDANVPVPRDGKKVDKPTRKRGKHR